MYSAVSLTEARNRRKKARELLAQGIDLQHQREDKLITAAANTFDPVAREWLTDPSQYPSKKPVANRTVGHDGCNAKRVSAPWLAWFGRAVRMADFQPNKTFHSQHSTAERFLVNMGATGLFLVELAEPGRGWGS